MIYISSLKLLINIVVNESTPILRNDIDEIEHLYNDEDAEEDQFFTSKGKSKMRVYYSSKLCYLEFIMMKTILSIDSQALKKILAFLSNLQSYAKQHAPMNSLPVMVPGNTIDLEI